MVAAQACQPACHKRSSHLLLTQQQWQQQQSGRGCQLTLQRPQQSVAASSTTLTTARSWSGTTPTLSRLMFCQQQHGHSTTVLWLSRVQRETGVQSVRGPQTLLALIKVKTQLQCPLLRLQPQQSLLGMQQCAAGLLLQ